MEGKRLQHLRYIEGGEALVGGVLEVSDWLSLLSVSEEEVEGY